MSFRSFVGRRRLLGASSAVTAWGAAALTVSPIVVTPMAAWAQAQTELPPVAVETQPISGSTLGTTILPAGVLATKAQTTDDTAAILSDVPGVSLNTGGGISSLPSIHGMADDRLLTLVDGVPITASCPNHMNPALSYIAPLTVAKAEVVAGITPVSQGGDSIGGTISVEPAAPVFAAPGEGLHYEGTLSTFYRSVNSALTSSAAASAASDTVSVGMDLSRAHALDYRDGDGDVVHASRYENYTGDAIVAVRGNSDQLVIRGGDSFTPYEGFPNQPMDLTYNRSNHVNADYQGEFDWGSLDARVYWQEVHHEMNMLFGEGGTPPGEGMPMMTHSQEMGYSVKANIPLTSRDMLRVGNELQAYTLNDWWPPTAMMGMILGPNTFQNIDDGRRDRIGTFAEWERAWTRQWTSLLGVRNDIVMMNTGSVQGYGSDMVDPDDAAAAAAFNAQNHAKTDVNFDATALARYQASDTNTEEFGYARKTRSPNLYERYAWSTDMAGMVGWFGDGNGYVGNPDLKPEVANTVSATAAWHDAAQKNWDVKVTPYYTYVQDYIGVDNLGPYMGGSGNLLRFANHDSELFGTDLSGRKVLARDTGYGDFDVKGTLGWERGIQIDNGENLYHMMPVNGKVTLEHALGGWSNAVDVQAMGAKDLVDTVRNEPTTPGYALVNLRSAYRWSNVTFSAGIENLFNKQYYNPLGGIDFKDLIWANSYPSTPFLPLPAPGRSFDAGVTITF